MHPSGSFLATAPIYHLEVEQNDDHSTQFDNLPPHVQIKLTSKSYARNQIIHRLRKYLLPTHPPNAQVNKIIQKHFSYSLNPIYQQISKLSQRLFVCGYCKEIYYGPSQYLLHCFEVDCPVNHNRSTYFFYFKDEFSLIQNIDIGQNLTESELGLFQSISYRKRTLIFSEIQVKPLRSDSSEWIFCGKCTARQKYCHRKMKGYYFKHCFLDCKSTKIPSNSHALIPVQSKQNLNEFVDDIINFIVNYHVIAFFDDSYIKLQKNLQFGNSNSFTHFCANCNSNFYNQTYFIQHCLFECNLKTNPKSSHIFKRKKIKVYQSQKIIQDQTQKEIVPKKKNLQTNDNKKIDYKKFAVQEQKFVQSFQSKQWVYKINPQLIDFRDLLQNIYFCGQCNCHFEDDLRYLIHCMWGFCELNLTRNSHFFYQKDSGQLLSRKKLNLMIGLSEKVVNQQMMKENFQIKSIMEECVEVINRSTNNVVKKGKIGNYQCGNCGKNFKKQQNFILHCLTICFSQNHQKNSHRIEFSNNKMIKDQDFRQFLMSYLYAIQIIKFSPMKKYRLTKNHRIEVDSGYLCGKCDTLFGNIYQYVLHSISVCCNKRSKYSSHFIVHQSLKSSSQIRCPLDILEAENFSFYSWKNYLTKNLDNLDQLKIPSFEPMQIEVNHSQSISQMPSHQPKIINDIREKQIKNSPMKGNEKSDQDQVHRFLIANTDFKKIQKPRFYCGQCQFFIKKEWNFVEHLKDCQSFENIQSSHFLLTYKRYEEINSYNTFQRSNYKPVPKNIESFRRFENENFRCGCGSEGLLDKYAEHIYRKHFGDVPKGSSHILMRLMYQKSNGQMISLPLPVDSKGLNLDHEFICPCYPSNKLKYMDYVNHIIKRHGGKSPKFWMRFKRQQ